MKKTTKKTAKKPPVVHYSGWSGCIPDRYPYLMWCRRWYKPRLHTTNMDLVTCKSCLRHGKFPHCPGRTFTPVYHDKKAA